MTTPRILATDLDGTLFPIDNDPDHRAAMRLLGQSIAELHLRLVFITGRSFEQVVDGIRLYEPPVPETIICDVGSTIMRRHENSFRRDDEYHSYLLSRLDGWTHQDLIDGITAAGIPVRPQPPHQQTDLKCSFYYRASDRIEIGAAVRQWVQTHDVPVTVTISVDPFTGDGLLDLLPSGAEKGSALQWWLTKEGASLDEVIFAGDTGNDTAAMTCGVRGILVANADDSLRTAAVEYHSGHPDRLYQSRTTATAGVLEGLQHYLSGA